MVKLKLKSSGAKVSACGAKVSACGAGGIPVHNLLYHGYRGLSSNTVWW
jgi:hypothetical protein